MMILEVGIAVQPTPRFFDFRALLPFFDYPNLFWTCRDPWLLSIGIVAVLTVVGLYLWNRFCSAQIKFQTVGGKPRTQRFHQERPRQAPVP